VLTLCCCVQRAAVTKLSSLEADLAAMKMEIDTYATKDDPGIERNNSGPEPVLDVAGVGGVLLFLFRGMIVKEGKRADTCILQSSHCSPPGRVDCEIAVWMRD
jgi:hypothetical protein